MKFALLRHSPEHPIEVWEYIDDLSTAMSYWYIKQAILTEGPDKVLPICMNRVGGYHTLHRPWLVGIIEADDWPSMRTHPTLFSHVINNPRFSCGWIDLEGNTYSCGYMEHARRAEEIIELMYEESYEEYRKTNQLRIPDDFLLRKGWVKLTSRKEYIVDYEVTTDKAMKTLERVLDGNKDS